MSQQNEYYIQQLIETQDVPHIKEKRQFLKKTDNVNNNNMKKQSIQYKNNPHNDLHKQTNNNKSKQYEYYRQQLLYPDGTFDLRFPQILNSPINKKWSEQLNFAVKFQLQKYFIEFKNVLKREENIKNVLKREENINLMSKQNEIKMTWLGHASICLSFAGKVNILIDPVFEDRIMDVIGQKRLIQPACKANQLPKIDVVLISHDHYDHCNTKTLEDIKKQFNKVQYIFGRNSDDILPKGYNYNQLSWTQSIKQTINGIQIKITFVPACHWSKRSLTDQNKRLWGGFVIQACGKKIYFPGDTGMCGLFKQLQQEFGYFDLSLLPIGAYEPNQQLRPQHINPRQAVLVHNIIKSKMSVGVHWGTFPMSHQTPYQVLKDFKQALDSKQSGQFIAVNIGGGVTIRLSQNDKYFTQNSYIKKGMIQV